MELVTPAVADPVRLAVWGCEAPPFVELVPDCEPPGVAHKEVRTAFILGPGLRSLDRLSFDGCSCDKVVP